MHVGVPVVPVSPAYSLMSKDFGKLRYIFELLRPGLVYAADPAKFGAALGAAGRARGARRPTLLAREPTRRVDAAFAASGRTPSPRSCSPRARPVCRKASSTPSACCAPTSSAAQAWPFLDDRPPVLVDWLPWNHTFGGNHNFNLVLRNGGTLYIDDGKPAPGLIETTVRNLREVAPTLYFNVPRGYDMLLP